MDSSAEASRSLSVIVVSDHTVAKGVSSPLSSVPIIMEEISTTLRRGRLPVEALMGSTEPGIDTSVVSFAPCAVSSLAAGSS